MFYFGGSDWIMLDRFECIDVLQVIWKIEVYFFNNTKFVALKLTKLAEKERCL